MQLIIAGERQIAEIQADFNKHFPFLKLEFFRHNRNRLDRYPAAQMISSKTKLQEAWVGKIKEGIAEISGDMTVLELEDLFMNRFALAAQVFRKSGSIWLETIRTDGWTLKQQNDHGMEICEDEHFREENDYDLSRDAGN